MFPALESLNSRRFGQVVAAVTLVGLVVVLQRLPSPMARRAEEGIRYLVSTEYPFRQTAEKLSSLDLPALADWARQRRIPFTPSATGKLLRPVEGGEVTSAFGWRVNPVTKKEEFHEGVDFQAPAGTAVVAAMGGRVVRAREEAGYGKVVEIEHGGGLTTVYAHNAEILVQENQRVSQGEVIAWVGKTGNTTAYHLHFEVRLGGRPVDPGAWLKTE